MYRKKVKRPQKRTMVVERKPYHPSPRAKMERMLGRKLLKGEIPVVPPSQLPRCPVPATHVKAFEDYCRDYEAGKMSFDEVVAKVNASLKTLKKPEPENKPSEAS